MCPHVSQVHFRSTDLIHMHLKGDPMVENLSEDSDAESDLPFVEQAHVEEDSRQSVSESKGAVAKYI